MTHDLVSVIIPTRNRSALLRETLQSVQFQTHSALEVLVIDDAGEDDTEFVVQQLSGSDSRIRYIRLTERKGAPHARNFGIRQCSGAYVQLLDSDDLLHREKFRVQVELLKAAPDADLAVCQTALFKSRPGDLDILWNRLEGDPLERHLKHDNVWVTVGPLWRREAFEKFGGHDESLPTSQDYEHATRALILGAKPILHRHLLAFYRVHGGPTIGSETLESRTEVHWNVFRSFEGLLNKRGLPTEANRTVMAENYLWVANRALEEGRSELATSALRSAADIDPDEGRRNEVQAVLRSGGSALAEFFEAPRYDRAIREAWWGHVTVREEPVLEIPRQRRYGRV